MTRARLSSSSTGPAGSSTPRAGPREAGALLFAQTQGRGAAEVKRRVGECLLAEAVGRVVPASLEGCRGAGRGLWARKCSTLLTRLPTKCSQDVVARNVTGRHRPTSREETADQTVFGGIRQTRRHHSLRLKPLRPLGAMRVRSPPRAPVSSWFLCCWTFRLGGPKSLHAHKMLTGLSIPTWSVGVARGQFASGVRRGQSSSTSGPIP
jgi:hypothetical protein